LPYVVEDAVACQLQQILRVLGLTLVGNLVGLLPDTGNILAKNTVDSLEFYSYVSLA